MDERRSALERLEKKLDSRSTNHDAARVQRSKLAGGSAQSRTKTAWERPNLRPRPPRNIRWVEIAFVGSIIFFIVAAAFAALLFFSGSNTVSTRNVDIAVDGPTSLRAGEVMTLQVVVTNRNTVPMELADLVVEFPSGTRSESNISIELPRLRESLGTIEPGESINKTIRAVIFGSAETEATTKITVEYRVPSSNAIFFGETEYALAISQSPASIVIEGLEEIVSGQQTALEVTISSNVPDVLADMLLVVDYPPGFAFSSASPKPFIGENVWRLGDIEVGGERTVTIRGSFNGEDGDERVVKFETGSEKETVEGEIAAPLAAGETVVRLAKPFVSASLALGGTVTTEYVASRGEEVRGDIRYTNNLASRVQDLEITVSLNGAILDRSSVAPDRGFYNSSQNTITWSKQTNPEFGDLSAGASGVLSFSLASVPMEIGSFRNPEIELDISVKVRRISETNVPETIESNSTARIVVGTDLILQSAVAGTNGPVPPQADQNTTYTINWTASNNTNAVANASASAVLPSYVQWEGSNDSRISFNAVGGIITWDIGDLAAGETKNTSFGVTLTPSLSQVGDVVTIISDQRVYGFDRFVRTQLERVLPSLTTVDSVQQ